MTYDLCDFLCPMDEVQASAVRQPENGHVRVGEKLLTEIDLDARLRSLFPQLTSEQSKELVLVTKINGMAVRVGSESHVASVAYASFRLAPFLIRAALKRRGVLALRFVEDRVQYVVDLPLLLRVFQVEVAS
jgi:hypothetical protein